MRFRIGRTQYRVRITEGPIVFEGAPCLGTCLEASREILLSADCDAGDRLRILTRELLSAWCFESGEPGTRAGWCDLLALVLRETVIDLNAQGGELALQSLRPGESPQPAAAKIGLTRNRCCGVCGGTVAGGSVECRVVSAGICELRLYCEHCDSTMTWREGQTTRGLPSGLVLGEPALERGDRRAAVAAAV